MESSTINLISLNIWGGKVFEPLIQFFADRKDDIDIFCLQEVFHTDTDIEWSANARINVLAEIKQALKNEFYTFYHPSAENSDYQTRVTDYHIEYGLCTFIRKKRFEIKASGEKFVFLSKFRDDGATGLNNRNVQFFELEFEGKEFALFNFHGLWTEAGKGDTPERIEQSKRIRTFMASYDCPQVLCGDFNLTPDTESIEILEEGMTNHIKHNNITNTRSSFYEKNVRFADYILTSPSIHVRGFDVLPDEVSDHLALHMQFTL